MKVIENVELYELWTSKAQWYLDSKMSGILFFAFSAAFSAHLSTVSTELYGLLVIFLQK